MARGTLMLAVVIFILYLAATGRMTKVLAVLAGK